MGVNMTADMVGSTASTDIGGAELLAAAELGAGGRTWHPALLAVPAALVLVAGALTLDDGGGGDHASDVVRAVLVVAWCFAGSVLAMRRPLCGCRLRPRSAEYRDMDPHPAGRRLAPGAPTHLRGCSCRPTRVLRRAPPADRPTAPMPGSRRAAGRSRGARPPPASRRARGSARDRRAQRRRGGSPARARVRRRPVRPPAPCRRCRRAVAPAAAMRASNHATTPAPGR